MIRKGHPRFGQAINGRGVHVRSTICTQFRAKIVHGNEQDVIPVLFLLRFQHLHRSGKQKTTESNQHTPVQETVHESFFRNGQDHEYGELPIVAKSTALSMTALISGVEEPLEDPYNSSSDQKLIFNLN
jgi:hypothetical protein